MLFVTGGRGFVGHHLVNGPASDGWEIIAPGKTSFDIRNRDLAMAQIVGWRPDAVIHLAYDKSDGRTIIDGSRNVAEAAAACGARLVHMSTDMVFAGQIAPYTEADPPRPITDYGRQKLAAEEYVAAFAPDAVIVRTSLVIGTDRLSPLQKDVEMSVRGGSRRDGVLHRRVPVPGPRRRPGDRRSSSWHAAARSPGCSTSPARSRCHAPTWP